MTAYLPTDDERMLRDAVRGTYARGAAVPWSELAEQGWLAAALPERAGGLGWGPRAAAILAEEMGRASAAELYAPEPYLEVAVMAAQVLLGLDEVGAGRIASGEDRTIVAHNEAEARGNPAWIGLEAEPTTEGFVLTGGKQAIVGAAQANRVLVSATVPGHGPTLFELPDLAAHRRDYALIDGRSASDYRLGGLEVPRCAIVGEVGQAGAALSRGFDHMLVISSAFALGAMQAAFDLTRDYLLTRKQYGKLLGDFQALRHRLADMFIALEQARSMVLRGVAALEQEDAAERSRIAAATKAKVAQAGLFVTGNAVQLHGGIGVTQEYPVGPLYVRMVAFENQYGPASAHIRRFAGMTERKA